MPTVLKAESIIEKLNDLIELDFDAIAAYKAAIDRLENPAYRNKLKEFLADHERHVRALSEAVQAEGGTPPRSGDFKKVLTKGQVVIADLGEDKHILKAMKMNEDQTNKKYEKAVAEGFPNGSQSAIENGLADERRHREWIETTLASISK